VLSGLLAPFLSLGFAHTMPPKRRTSRARKGDDASAEDALLVRETPSTPTALARDASPAPARRAASPATTAAKSATGGGGSTCTFAVVMAAVLAGAAYEPTTWAGLLAILLTMATFAVGVDQLKQIWADGFTRPGASWAAVPLTDATLNLGVANKLANSAQCREKSLKIVQYILKAGSYSGLFSKAVSKHMKALSKQTSIARRFFKFCRWVKHFEDLSEAHEEKAPMLRALLYLRVAANFGADWAEDVCSLERIGFLPAGTLSVEFMLFAEYCQLVLAMVEVYVTTARVRAQEGKAAAAAAAGDGVKAQRKLSLLRLELVKFVSDIGKAAFDCEMPYSHEGVFIGCSLFSALVSTHKNIVKVV